MGRLVNRFVAAMSVLAVCASPIPSTAQEVQSQTVFASFPKEEVKIVANAEIVLSGQMLGYQTTCLTNNISNNISNSLSTIVYVELISDAKTVIFKHKLKVESGKAYGDYFIPTTLKTGHYKLIAYTEWSLNNAVDAYDQADVFVINPYLDVYDNNLKATFESNTPFVEISIGQNLDYVKTTETNGLKLLIDSETYKHRSRVSLKLQNTLNAINHGSFAVSVKKIDSLEVKNSQSTTAVSIKTSPKLHVPEMRGELIKGQVLDITTNEPVSECPVSLSIAGEHQVYKSTKTNSKGEFYFNLFEPYEQEKAHIQVVKVNRDDYKITMESKAFDRYDELEFYPLKLNSNLKKYITQHSIYNQVESAYYNLKRDSIKMMSEGISFYGKPDVVYILDDFTRFNSVNETFIEVIEDAAIRKSGDRYQFLVYDFDSPYNTLYDNVKPLVLVDGVQLQDENILIEYNPALIESVSLVRGLYSFGSVIYNGIMDVKLKKPLEFYSSGSYLAQLDIQKLVTQKNYFKQEYEINQNRTPDFRTQLLWKPDFELNSDIGQIDFYTSDISGYFMIELKGTTNAGKPIQLQEIFKVVH